MPEPFFIVNPAAGNGRAIAVWRRVEPLAASLGGCEARFTEGPGHAGELARQAAEKGHDRVVVLGGDGTLNEAGNGLVGTGAALAVVPAGTTNDWVRTFGIPADVREATVVAYRGRLVRTDIGLAVGVRYFFNMAGIGFDAEVAHRVNRHGSVLKTVGGTLPTVIALLGTLLAYRAPAARLGLDGETVEVPSLLLCAAGVGRHIGGGMMMLPEAVADDGLFDVLWARGMGRLEVLRLLARVYSGGHTADPRVLTARCRRLTVTSERPLALHLDGEVVGTLPVTLEIVPEALDVVVPA